MFWLLKRAIIVGIIGSLGSLALPQFSMANNLEKFFQGGGSSRQVDNVEIAFSPNGGATSLVVRTIEGAQQSIRVAAYSFTSKPIAKALIQAHKRGVDVRVVVDKSQLSEKYTSATFLANVGIPVRVDTTHKIQHNKYLVVDNKTVELGSFNYTSSAEDGNAENVMVVHDNPNIANLYLNDWGHHWDHAQSLGARY